MCLVASPFGTDTSPNTCPGSGFKHGFFADLGHRKQPSFHAAAAHVMFPPTLGNRGTVIKSTTQAEMESAPSNAFARTFHKL